MHYDYDKAVSRNIGWVTPAEQARLRQARVAIAGLGGVGGAHALTLARLGIGAFNLADFDAFEVHNFNRQAGAYCSTVGQAKADVIRRMVLDVLPEGDVRSFGDGVTPANIDEFLRDVDVYVDGIDFFAMPARRLLFSEARRRGIPALTAAPLGMGVALLYFSPQGMSFDDYFRLEGVSEEEQYLRLMVGLSPALLQRTYLAMDASVDFSGKAGPSTAMACELCAGVMGTAVLKLLLGRGPLKPAPWGMHFDAYRGRLAHTWRPGGNANPLQRLLLAIVRRRLRAARPGTPSAAR